MSDPAAAGSAPPVPVKSGTHAGQPVLAFPYAWKVAVTVAIIMVLLALLGVGLTTAKSTAASVYWISMVPTYGVLCVVTAYLRAKSGQFDFAQAYRQVWHWLGIGLAVGLDFYVLRIGEESGMGAGMVALLLLATGCFLAGVHFEWLFILVGILLGVTMIVVGTAEQYLWLVFVVGVAAVVLMFLLPRIFGHRHG